jgi:hypothetical protein
VWLLPVLLAPAALSSALPADAKKLLGVDILGSRITLFRDENGKVSTNIVPVTANPLLLLCCTLLGLSLTLVSDSAALVNF